MQVPHSDELLAVRCLLGEADAFDDLVARWHPSIWRYVRHIAGADDVADDLAQDVWLRVLRGLPRLKEPARIRAWIFGIARRVLMDRLRAKYVAPAEADVNLDTLQHGGDDDELRQRIDDVEVALASLPTLEREVLTLFYLDDLSLVDIASIADVPVGTVKSRLFRARRLLRAAMTNQQT